MDATHPFLPHDVLRGLPPHLMALDDELAAAAAGMAGAGGMSGSKRRNRGNRMDDIIKTEQDGLDCDDRWGPGTCSLHVTGWNTHMSEGPSATQYSHFIVKEQILPVCSCCIGMFGVACERPSMLVAHWVLLWWFCCDVMAVRDDGREDSRTSTQSPSKRARSSVAITVDSDYEGGNDAGWLAALC